MSVKFFKERTEQAVGQGELPSTVPGCTEALPKLYFLCFKFGLFIFPSKENQTSPRVSPFQHPVGG